MSVTVYTRLDKYLADNGYAGNADRGRALIETGKIMVNGQVITSPAFPMHDTFKLEVVQDNQNWISKDGLKIDYALQAFGINPAGRTVIDVAAGAGGFINVLLHKDVKHVYCVESSNGSLPDIIRADERVTVLEETDPRSLTADMFKEPVDLIICGIHFSSLTDALPELMDLVGPKTDLVAVIMPQFEVDSPDVILSGGVVVDPELHRQACGIVESWLRDDMKWTIKGFTPNPVASDNGNREFFVHAKKP